MNKINRVYNFAAGPATLPERVLKVAQKEMLDYKGSGMSVMEMSHRSDMFKEIIDGARNSLKQLLNISDDYEILFLQGGASTQFSAVPLHLLKNKAAYINTGHWSNRAISDAKMYGEVKVVASSEESNFSYIPNCQDLDIDDCDYLYYCDNNTIFGTKFKEVPNSKDKILVCDMSSSILSEKIDVSKYGIIFAGAQKNIGPAGLTIVIIRKDLIDECNPLTPTMLRYKKHSAANSLFNTPPTYAIYICSLVFKNLIEHGGLEEVEKKNKFKAEYLYNYLDSSKLYKTQVNKKDRSYMNVVFTTGSEDLDKLFVTEAKEKGLVNLKGHKLIGGLRASIYNAMEIDGVIELVNFMREFEVKHV